MRIINEKPQNTNKNKWTAADVREAILIFTLAVVNFACGYYYATVQIAARITNAN